MKPGDVFWRQLNDGGGVSPGISAKSFASAFFFFLRFLPTAGEPLSFSRCELQRFVSISHITHQQNSRRIAESKGHAHFPPGIDSRPHYGGEQ